MAYRTACAVFVAFVLVSSFVTRPGQDTVNIIATCIVGFACLCLYVVFRLLDLHDRQQDTLRVSRLADEVIRECVREARFHRQNDFYAASGCAERSEAYAGCAFAIARRWS